MYPSLSTLVPISSLLSLYFLYFHHFPSFSLHLLSLLVTSMFVFPFLFYSRALHPLLFFRFILLGSFHLSLSLSNNSHSSFFITFLSISFPFFHPFFSSAFLPTSPLSSMISIFLSSPPFSHIYIFLFFFPSTRERGKRGGGGFK